MAPTIRKEDRLTAGYRLSHPPPGEEVVISGISGVFPESDSILHLQENLFNKMDLITSDHRRWSLSHPEIPIRSGKLNNISKFDASFFNVHYREAEAIDPMARILLEKAYEAIIDAGYNPDELRNTKTGVFMGQSFSESEKVCLYEKMHVNSFGIAGSSRAMLANRISYWLGVSGPSYTLDTACSSSMYAMEHAFRAIRNGDCDAAIVGGAHLCLNPFTILQFYRMGVLSNDGRCKSFDDSANGYVRSEAIAVCFLQKAKDSRRCYAQMVYAKTNCDGYKDQGIHYPSGKDQAVLLNEFYEECCVSPSSLEYLEAHATGTKVGDPEEMEAVDKIICSRRSEPLLVGSVKSNLGHSEPSAPICSIAKLCIAYSTGYIPPNINYNLPRKSIAAIMEGRAKVVTEKTPWNRGMSGLNSFGFGGANAHGLFNNIARPKVNNGLPADDLPRLVCTSGRTESAVARILDDLESRTVDAELVRLLHAIHDRDIIGHDYRGYTLLKSTPTKSVKLARHIHHFSGVLRPVCFVYSGLGSQWAGTASQLMRIPIFAAAFEKCHETLEPKGIDLTKIIADPDPTIHDNILSSFVGIAAVQIGLTDVLKTVGIEPDYIIGHSTGELGSAYADGCLTAEQAILSAYNMGLALTETKFIRGSMADVSVGQNEIQPILPSEIVVAHHNGPDSCTISGPEDKIKTFVAKLVAQQISAEEVPSFNVAFHSQHIAKAGPKLLKYLKQEITTPKNRSKRWLSTSVHQALWKDAKAEMSSAEYYTNNLLSPVLFEEAMQLIPSNAIIIKIAPHGVLNETLPRSLTKGAVSIALSDKNHPDNVQVLLTALGKIFEAGLNPHLANIYPTIEFPVSQGTPMLSHLVEWEHRRDWHVSKFEADEKLIASEKNIKMYIGDEYNEYLVGHVIDGRNLYPATGYLVMVWETFAMMMGSVYTDLSVVFENVRFKRATRIPTNSNLEFIVMVQKGTGEFEIFESGASVTTGRIYAKEGVGRDFRVLPEDPESKGPNVKHMLSKEFYKELRLRGYQYSGVFRGVLGCNVEGTRGRVAWIYNWVTFMDCMLQLKIVDQDTRGLFVPTRIEKLSIDTKMHYEAVSKMKPGSTVRSFEARVYRNLNVFRAGGVEIRGLNATPILKKIPLGVPVLEKNVFVPNFGQSPMTVEDVLRSYIQLILENIRTYKVKTIEIVDDEYKTNGFEPVTGKVSDVLGDLPLIQSDLSVISEDPIEMPSNINVDNKKISGDANALIFIGAKLFQRPDVLKQALNNIRDKGFIISREKDLINTKDFPNEYDIISIQNTGSEYMVLFRKRVSSKSAKFIKIVTADDTYAWIDKVKEVLDYGQNLVIYSQDDEVNGLLGLVNCLRKEPGGEIVRGLLIADPSAPQFNPDLEFYEEQLDKDLAINVYEDGQWGTYRHLLLDDLDKVKTKNAYVNANMGDMSSLRWMEGHIRVDQSVKNSRDVIVHVYSCGLNFRDVAVITGRVPVDAVARGRLAQECVIGLEVVGRTSNGTRVMSMVTNKGLTNMALADSSTLCCIPDEWTFEEAATIPVAYYTAFYGLVMIGRIKTGDKILIHAGSGGVGQAAINVALHYGAEVFTTVGTPEKRAFIKRMFPQIKDSHIGNSRDTSFEEMVKRETNGKGVDLVLNSLSDDKLYASVRCLARGGRFLEIGKYDINNNTPIDMTYYNNEVSFHGIMLDYYNEMDSLFREQLNALLVAGIVSGAVRPLTYTTFDKDELETGFRYMAAGKHIGKVVFKIRDEERSNFNVKPTDMLIEAMPRYTCDPDLVYVVVGGLGGFGLELADWLILREARKVLLTSRKGVTNGYQSSRLRTWTTYGADVRISTHDVTTEEGCEQMLKMANSMGTVEAIFNLAVILKDCIFQNQTPETFKTSFAPKALATMNLDKLSQKLCPQLKNFVVFSSVSCGRGNAGQTNYGFSNSVMERICERRRRLGLPALAVQWGAVGDVGLVADMQDEDVQLEIGGTLQQRISSCLLSLDKFMKQESAIVSSIVVAEKKIRGSGSDAISETVADILGIKDLKLVPQQMSLADLGMDSMMAVEIKQTLERDFEVFLTAQEIRNLTFARLVELTAQKEVEASKAVTTRPALIEDTVGFQVLMRNYGEESMASEPFIYMPTMVSDGSEIDGSVPKNEATMFILPGIEGYAAVTASLCRGLKIKACVLQLGYQIKDDTLDTLVDRLLKTIKSKLNPGSPFILLGYSFGTLPMMKLAHILESKGHTGILFCIDGSPEFLSQTLHSNIYGKTDAELQTNMIRYTIEILSPNNEFTDALMEKLKEVEEDTFEEKIKYGIKASKAVNKFSVKFMESMAKNSYDRLKMVRDQTEMKKIKAPIVLLKPTENPSSLVIDEKYGLDRITEGPVSVHLVDGNHVTIIDNKECANIINKILISEVLEPGSDVSFTERLSELQASSINSI